MPGQTFVSISFIKREYKKSPTTFLSLVSKSFGRDVKSAILTFVKIREVYTKQLIVDFFSPNFDFLATENTKLVDYPKVKDTISRELDYER